MSKQKTTKKQEAGKTRRTSESELNSLLVAVMDRWEREEIELEESFDFGRGGADDGGFDDGQYRMLQNCIEAIREITEGN